MATVMKQVGLNASEVFPWDEFVESIKDLRTICIIHGILNTPIILLETSAVSRYLCEEPEFLESIIYVDRTPLICKQFKEMSKYRARMIDGLMELYDRLVG